MKHLAHRLNSVSGKHGAFAALYALSLIFCASSALAKQQDDANQNAAANPGANITSEIVSANGYPELRVGGQPFFVHAATFDYFSIPRDLWEHSLENYKDLGFNTIALRIPWNWHEPNEGEFDFDGHSNPRRDLRTLLHLIAATGFKLIAAPGPVLGTAVGQRWPNGGLPDWFLGVEGSKFGAVASAIGHVGPAEEYEAIGAREAPAPSLRDETHLRFIQRWLAAVAHELLPYPPGKSAPRDDSVAPVLFVVLGAPAALQSASPDSNAQYADQMKQCFVNAGLDARYLVTALSSGDTGARFSAGDNIGVAGSLLRSNAYPATNVSPLDLPQSPEGDNVAESISLLTQSLRLSQSNPVIISDFGQELPQPTQSAAIQLPSDRFLAWSAFVTQGAAAVIHTSPQNTLPPAGFLMNDRGEDVHRYAALDFSGDPLPHSERVRRERALVTRLGTFFASSHRRTVLGIVDWRSGSAFSDAISGDTRRQVERDFNVRLRQLERVSSLANIPAELADLGEQSLEVLAHDPVLLLVVPENLRGQQFLSVDAQNSLLNFVRRGGALICDPELPLGDQIAAALQNVEVRPTGDGITVRILEEGRIIVWTKTFSDWVDPEESPSQSRAHLESAWAIENLGALVTQQSQNLPVLRSNSRSDELVVSEMVPNEGAASATTQSPLSCKPSQPCAQGVLSVANWSDSEVQETLRILPPAANARLAHLEDYVELPVTLRARDALFLPLDVSLCGAERKYILCSDRIIASGAEFVSAIRDGKFLELTFYAPSKATIILHLAAPPRHLELPERTLEGQYVVAAQTFTMSLPRGAAPDFLRTVKLDLQYTPFVAEAPKPERTKSRAYRFSVSNAIRLPLGEGASLATDPPLLTLDSEFNGRVLLHFQNLAESPLTLHVDILGVAAASRTLRLESRERNDYAFDLHGSSTSHPGSDGLLHGLIHVSGGDRDSDLPLEFVVEAPKTFLRYRTDFARDGAPNWVLENDRFRMIVSPATDGSIAALVEKDGQTDIFSAGGGVHDLLNFANPQHILDVMRNIVFTADWDADPKEGIIHLHGTTPESLPTRLQIEKTLRLLDSNELQIEYHLQSAPQTSNSTSATSLMSEFSFPAFAGGATGTQFCWQPSATTGAAGSQMNCEPFTPNGQPVLISEHVARLEIRTLNRATLSIAWNAGSIAIDQRDSFVRLLWNLPPITSDRDSTAFILHLALVQSH